MNSKSGLIYAVIAVALIFCGCENKTGNCNSADDPGSCVTTTENPGPAAASSAASISIPEPAISTPEPDITEPIAATAEAVQAEIVQPTPEPEYSSPPPAPVYEESSIPGFDDLAYGFTPETVTTAAETGTDSCNSASLISRIPPRNSGSPSGEELVSRLINISGTNRDQAIVEEVMAGNIPPALRQLVPVEMAFAPSGGERVTVTICVTPDYLSVGNAADNVRFPLGLPAALNLSRSLNFVLPTVKMVDAIYAGADVKLSPSPKTPNNQMETTRYIHEHNQTINEQIGNRRGLIAGHKKDVVLSRRLLNRSGRIAIYGWHRANGNPIQSLSTVHHANYADYSHGIRLISNTAFVNGEPHSLIELLQDSRYAPALSDEGTLPGSLLSN
jgi:hypothetical protein